MSIASNKGPSLSRRIVLLFALGLGVLALTIKLDSIVTPVLGQELSAGLGAFLIGFVAYWGPMTLFPGKTPASPLARVGLAAIFGAVMALANWVFGKILR